MIMIMMIDDNDDDRMNFENDQFLRRQQQIMQLELAEAAKVNQLSVNVNPSWSVCTKRTLHWDLKPCIAIVHSLNSCQRGKTRP